MVVINTNRAKQMREEDRLKLFSGVYRTKKNEEAKSLLITIMNDANEATIEISLFNLCRMWYLAWNNIKYEADRLIVVQIGSLIPRYIEERIDPFMYARIYNRLKAISEKRR